MKAVLTPNDLKIGDQVSKPGWKPMELTKYEETTADKDQSTNVTFYFQILDGEDKGKVSRVFGNEKFLGYLKNLWKALRCPQDAEGNYEVTTEFCNEAVGTKLKGYWQVGKSATTGKPFNEITDYQPLA